MEHVLTIFAIITVLFMAYNLITGFRCPNCHSRLKVYEIKSSTGINITKKIIFTAAQNPKQENIFICDKCNKKYLQKTGSKRFAEYHD